VVDSHATSNPAISDVKREKTWLKLRVSLEVNYDFIIFLYTILRKFDYWLHIVVSVGRTTTSPRAPSPKTTQRRTLPRPSQASSNLRYTSSRLSNPGQTRMAKTITPPRAASPAQADLWGDDEVY